jgi:hypothetical protein
LLYRARTDDASTQDVDAEQDTEEGVQPTNQQQGVRDSSHGEPHDEENLTKSPSENDQEPTADTWSEAEQALAESRGHLDNEAYEAALDRANDGLKQVAAIESREGHGSDSALTELRTDLQAVRQSVEHQQWVNERISDARKSRETVERALRTGEFARAETALDELNELVEPLDDSSAEVELKEASRALKQQLIALQAAEEFDRYVDELQESDYYGRGGENKIDRSAEVIEDAEFDRAATRLEAAETELERAAELNRSEGLDREEAIEAKRTQTEALSDETTPRVEVINTVSEAETLVEQGIDHREANEPAAALEAFSAAKQQYASAAEFCETNELEETWEIHERHLMLESYVTVVQNELNDHHQAITSSLDKQLETAIEQLDRTTQYTEVEDYVLAHETLGVAVLALDKATQLLERNQVDDEYHKRYDTLVERAGRLHEQLPEQKETGEYSTRVLVESLQELATKLTESPQPEFVNKYGEYPSEAYLEAFGSWPEALAAANLDPVDQAAHERRKYSRVEVLDALVECARKVGHPPDQSDMNKHGAMSTSPVSNRFVDWDAALELAGLGDGEIPPEPDAPEPNELAELYDIFKTLSTLLEAYLEADGRYQLNDDSPLAEWQATLESRWTGDGTPGHPVYGVQQAERNSFSMSDYRAAYANGSRVTDFQVVETEPLPDQSQERLLEHDLIDPDEALYVPVSPRTGSELSLFVEDEEPLRKANSVLNEFPNFPAAELPKSVLEPETRNEDDTQEEVHSESESSTVTAESKANESSVSESSSEMVTKLLGDMGFGDSERETAND